MGIFSKPKPVEIELGPKLFKAIVNVMYDSTGSTNDKNIAYAGRNVKQDLTIVGESNYQESIALFKKGWSYGLLVPEQDNEYDKNAVALYLIDSKYEIHKVGYLPKELAAKVSKPITNLLIAKGQVVPVLAKVDGGTKDKPILGVFAYARTDAIIFE
jgi:hypothetical protein